MARVLVTGATGFIGQHLVRYLAEYNHDLVCLVRKNTVLQKNIELPARFVQGDITRWESVNEAVRGCDVVINLAGVTKSFHRKEMYAVNQEGADNVARACAHQANPPVLIQISSLSAAGPVGRINQPKPRSQDRTVSIYGRSKLKGEKAVQQYADRVPVTILRPPIVFGEGDRDVLPIFKSVQRFGWAFGPAYSDDLFSFVHVHDLVQAIRLLMLQGARIQTNHPMGVYHVESEGRVSFRQFAKMIGQTLNRTKVKVVAAPTWLTWVVGGFCEMGARVCRRPFVMSLDKAREANAGSWSCNANALRQIGYKPGALSERIKQTSEWYQRAGWIKSVSITPDHRPEPSLPFETKLQKPGQSQAFEKQLS